MKFDALKIAVAVLFVLAGIGGFYYFADHSLPLRVIGLLLCLAAAVALYLQTEQGRATWAFVQEAQVEVRKVVWPTRQETTQTTGIVIIVVLVFAGVLWLLDMFLGWAVQGLIGQ